MELFKIQAIAPVINSTITSPAFNSERHEASNAVRELREGLAAKQQMAFRLQQKLERRTAGSTRDWTSVSAKGFAGGRLVGVNKRVMEVL